MKNNKGMTLIELIVVIGILAVMAGVLTLGMGFLPAHRISSCTRELKLSLNRGRVEAMSRENVVLTILRNGDGTYVIKQNGDKVKNIGSSGISIRYEDSKGKSHDIGAGEKLVLSYDRASGALRPLIREVKDDGTLIYESDEAGNYLYCTRITIGNDRKQESLVLVKATGKIYLE